MGRKSLQIGERGDISTLKMKSGKWRARCSFRDSDGRKKPMSRYGRTKQAAIGRLKDDWVDFSRLIMNGRRAAASPTTVRELHARWKQHEWKKATSNGYPKVSTLKNRHSVFEKHVLSRIGDIPVTQLTVAGLDEMLADIPQPDGRYLSTAAQAQSGLRAFCRYAMSHQLLSANLARETEVLRYQAPDPRPLTAQEIARLRHAVTLWQNSRANIRIPLLDIIDFMLGTGCRIGEALAMQWHCTYLNDRIPWVRIEFTVTAGHNGPSSLGSTKAKKILHVALPIFAAEMLYRRWAAAGYPSSGFVFHRRSGKAYTSSEINTAGRRALAGHNIVDEWDGGFRSHAIRKSVLNSVNDAYGISAAAEQGGHSHQSTTKKYYLAPNVKTINYTESLNLLLSMETPVLAGEEASEREHVGEVENQRWIPTDVRRIAEAIIGGQIPDPRQPRPVAHTSGAPASPAGLTPAASMVTEVTTAGDRCDETIAEIVDEAPLDDCTAETDDQATIGATEYWEAAKAHASRGEVRGSHGGGIVHIEDDVPNYRPTSPRRRRIVSTQHLKKLRVRSQTLG